MSLSTIWLSTTIGDICTKVTDGSHNPPKATDSGLPMLSAKNIHHGLIDFDEEHRLIPHDEFEVENKRTQIAKDDVLLTIVGTLGRTAVVQNDLPRFTLQRSVAVLRPLIDPRYFRYYLESPSFQKQILDNAKGTAQKGVYLKTLKSLKINIYPLAEQQVIADKLDTLLAQVESIKTRLERIPEILKQFRQSVLAAAVSGKLTEDWRVKNIVGSGKKLIQADALLKQQMYKLQPELKKKKSSIESDIDKTYLFDIPDSWGFSTWGKVSEWITYGFTKPMPKSEEGVKLLTAKDVQYFSVDIAGAGCTTLLAFDNLSDKDRPQKGDLLITKDGSIGRAALVRSDESFCINQSVAVCWLRSTTMNKDYLEILANSDFTQKFIRDKAQGMAIQHLSIIDYAKCPLPVPSLPEQNEIVSQVQKLTDYANIMEKQVNSALDRVNNLTQSILTKAFRGELTAEWRDANLELIGGENSAEALLKRIKAERESAKSATKRGRGKA